MQQGNEMTLYGISAELNDIFRDIAENGGELTELNEDRLTELKTVLKDKTDNVVAWARKQDNFVQAIDERVKELMELRAKVSASSDKFNAYILTCMDILGEVKIEGDFDKVQIDKPRQICVIEDESKIPIEYVSTQTKTISKVDKGAILKALKNGEEIPGARIGSGTRKVKFKTK